MNLEAAMRLLAINDEPVLPLFPPYSLPKSVITTVFFQYVTGAEWGALLLTSKSWNEITKDPISWKRIFDREGLRYFDEEKCKKYRGNPGKVPPISLPKAYAFFNSACKLFPGKKVKETHKLQLFYKEINQKPITLNFVKALARDPKEGGTKASAGFHGDSLTKVFDIYGAKAFRIYGEIPLTKSFWAFVTVKQLDESYLLSEEALVQLAAKYPHYRLHRIVERSIANFDNLIDEGDFLDGRSYFTICEETVTLDTFYGEKKYNVVVGAGDQQKRTILVDENVTGFIRGVTLLREF